MTTLKNDGRRQTADHGLHFHVIAYWGGYGTDPFERFDTREEAEAFTDDSKNVRDYGRMEVIECGRNHN